MRILNLTIYLLLFISIWIILSVGLNLIPVFEIDISYEKAERINRVIINVSYSYLAGYIMYLLTVSLPSFRRKKTMIPLINNYINTYCSQSLFSFFMFYNNSELLDIDIKEHQNVKEIVSEYKQSEKMLDTISKSHTFQSRKEILTRFNDESNLFFNRILPYEEFLVEKQLEIINNIRQDNFLTFFDYYDKVTEELEDLRKSFYDRFESHTELIFHLSKTLQLNPTDNFYWMAVKSI